MAFAIQHTVPRIGTALVVTLVWRTVWIRRAVSTADCHDIQAPMATSEHQRGDRLVIDIHAVIAVCRQ